MSYQFTIDSRRRAIGRIVQDIRNELQRAYAERHERDGLTQADLARELGVDRSVIHRMLSGDTNLTARSIASLIVAMDKSLAFRIVDRDGIPERGRNDFQVARTAGSQVSRPPIEGRSVESVDVLVAAG